MSTRTSIYTEPTGFAGVWAVERANARANGHWFDADTRKFFGSRIGSQLYGGRYFTTSERSGFDHSPRRYSVRVALDSGEVETVGEFLDYGYQGAAKAVAIACARPLAVEVRHDPYPNTPASRGERAPEPRHYEWRVYVVTDRGAFPIGSRNTRYAARRLRVQLDRTAKARKRAGYSL